MSEALAAWARTLEGVDATDETTSAIKFVASVGRGGPELSAVVRAVCPAAATEDGEGAAWEFARARVGALSAVAAARLPDDEISCEEERGRGVLEVLLWCAVCERATRRGDRIGGIMAMEPVVQKALMGVIERQMTLEQNPDAPAAAPSEGAGGAAAPTTAAAAAAARNDDDDDDDHGDSEGGGASAASDGGGGSDAGGARSSSGKKKKKKRQRRRSSPRFRGARMAGRARVFCTTSWM